MRRGIEGTPVRLMLSVFLMAVVLALAFYEINAFREFNDRRNFVQSVTVLVNGMSSLARSSDPGSFMMVKLDIPANATIILDNQSNKIVAAYGNEQREYNVTGRLLWYRQYNASTRNVQLYYGDPGPEKESDENMIAFVPE